MKRIFGAMVVMGALLVAMPHPAAHAAIQPALQSTSMAAHAAQPVLHSVSVSGSHWDGGGPRPACIPCNWTISNAQTPQMLSKTSTSATIRYIWHNNGTPMVIEYVYQGSTQIGSHQVSPIYANVDQYDDEKWYPFTTGVTYKTRVCDAWGNCSPWFQWTQ